MLLHIHQHNNQLTTCIVIYIKIFINKKILLICTYRKYKGWERMVENCSICGSKLEGDVKFCPECGEQIPLAKETKKVETKVKSKAKTKKKTTVKFSLPKISLRNAPKPMIAGIALLCIAIIAVAGVVVISPFDMTGSVSNSGMQETAGGRVFSVIVENFCDTEATCYLTVGGLKYKEVGNNGDFTIPARESITLDIVEDILFIVKTNYDISLFATIDYQEKGTVSDVTESAEFSISEMEGELIVESTAAR